MNDVLFDTNMLIYAIDEDSKYYSETHSILSDKSIKAYTSSKNIAEFLAVITRLPDSEISTKQAVEIVEDFTRFFSILYPTVTSFKFFLQLLNKYTPSGLKIHDYEILSIALANNIKSIASFNKKDFANVDEIKLI